MKALMFGGAFNPPTKAHIELADAVRKVMEYDRVIFVPSKSTYIRDTQKKDFSFPEEERLRMLRLISIDRAWMFVSPYEINMAEQPRTFDTLNALKEQYKPEELKLLIGTDKLVELNPARGIWRHVEEIAVQYGFVVMERNGDKARKIIEQDPFLRDLKDHFTVVSTPASYSSISSSEVRQTMLEMHQNIKKLQDLVPPELHGMRDYYSDPKWFQE
jgi:nicotinate-nucleotide adenylyltransferase